ncbi:MAG: chromate transporter, partial [Alphaproteobacteria bacterium]|nr:chromate transporter [Alphaproteobacteria bacterium]
FHRQVVGAHGWMGDAQFAQLVAIAQIAPGPNMLVVSLIGWKVAGLQGLIAATLGLVAPTAALAFAAGRRLERWRHAPWLANARAATAPVVVGLMGAAGYVIAEAANPDWRGYIITAIAAALMYFTSWSPLRIVALGAACGIALWAMGVPFSP